MYRVQVEPNVRCAVLDLNPRCTRTIVFVHGWPFDHRIFESQYEVLPEYGIRCVGIDLRGFGASDQPWKGYSYDCMADDIHKVISNLDTKCVTLCGFSMGGAACVRYMARHRGYKVNKLVLMGAACPSFVQRPGYPWGMSREQVDQLVGRFYENRPQTIAQFARGCFATPPGEEYMQWLNGVCTDAAGWATIKCCETLRDEDLRGDLQKIKTPTAIFHGVLDQVCPYTFAEEMHKGIADSFVVPFERSGHCLFFEEKNQCNSALIDFVTTPNTAPNPTPCPPPAPGSCGCF